MKSELILGVLVTTLACTAVASLADEYVRGYTRRDGTYVAPYVRSEKDSSYNNNWSVKGNENPYSGQEGTKSPTWNDRTPAYNNETNGNSGYTYGNGNSSRSGGRTRSLYGY